MIDKIIHQIWVGPYNIPKKEQKLSQDFRSVHSDWEYYFWSDNNLPKIPEHLKSMYETMYNKKDYVYCADMLRWLVVLEYGGWYLDIDWEAIRSLDTCVLPERDGIVFGHFGGGEQWLNNKIGEGWSGIDHTVTNNVFGFKKNHPMVQFVVENIFVDLNYLNTPYSPQWTGESIKKYLGLPFHFTDDVWEYHHTMQKKLDEHNIEYGDYNTFNPKVAIHHALYAWSFENKIKFEQGLIK
jgi:mannosyltransferase OCH1-like enzyme